MNLTDILAQAGGIESMAKELGIPPAMAKQGADALLPAILGGFKKQAQSGGVEGLGGLLGQLGGGGLLDSVLGRSEEHTSELQSLMRISYAVFCLKKKKKHNHHHMHKTQIVKEYKHR